MKGFCELIPHGLITIFDENELEVIYQFIYTRPPIHLLHRIKSILFYEEDGPVSYE